MAFNPKDLNAYKEFLSTQQKISETISKGTKSFATGVKDAMKAARDLNKIQAEYNRLKSEEENLNKQIADLEKKNDAESKRKLELAKERLKVIQAEKKATDEILQKQKALSKALTSQVASVKNLAVALGRDTLKALTKVTKQATELGKEFSENDDAIRRTAVNVGVMGKQFNMLRKNAYKAALVTQRIGVDAKELVESYGSYVDEVGRLIPLTVSAGKAMAYMSKGTALGSQGAVQMAASMEVFGMTIESTAGYVEDVVNMSERMGVNSGKTLKILQQNLRKAQTVRFKGGVAGMAKMAAKSAAIRMDMSSALDLANQLFEPEKAIETAATLQMMGGAFARMADPIQLMFNARNNPAKLMEDLASAAGSVAKRMGDGTYDIPAMELQKLQEIAKQTGLSFEEMVETAKTSARRNDIGKMLSPTIKGEAREFVKSIAQFKGGKFKVDVDGKFVEVSKLSQQQIKSLMEQDATLKKRAEQSQGFMTRLKNIFESLKNLAMSFFAGMDASPLGKLLDQLGSGGGLAKLSDNVYRMGQEFGGFLTTVVQPFLSQGLPMLGNMVGRLTEMAGKTADWIKNANEKLGGIIEQAKEMIRRFWEENGKTISTFATAAGMIAKGMWKAAKWIAETFGAGGAVAAILLIKFPGILKALMSGLTGLMGMGKSTPQAVYIVGGGGPGGGPGGALGGRNMGQFGQVGRRGAARMGTRQAIQRYGGGRFGRMMAGGFGRGGGLSFGASAAKGMRAFTGLGLVGLGADIGRTFLDDPDSAMGKTLGVLGTTASDAATGAMIGSIIPGVGTALGGIIGGVIGFGRSMYKELTTKGMKDYDMATAKSNVESNKLAFSTSARMADGAVLPNGNVIKTAKGEMYSLAPKDVVSIGQPGGGSSSTVGGNVNVNISGTINLSGGGGSSISLDGIIKDPEFKSEITKIVVKQMKEQNR